MCIRDFERYEISGDALYEWHHNFEGLAGVLEAVVPSCGEADKLNRILMLGCGNSPFSADMYDAGYEVPIVLAARLFY